MTKTYQKKYRPNQPEDLHKNGKVNRLAFVSRIVNTENKPLSVKEAWSLTNKRDAKNIGLTQARFGAALSAAVQYGRLDKTRIQETPTKFVVKYHPLDMKPMGLDIPVPYYTRDIKDDDVFTFDDDDEVWDDDDDEMTDEDKPDAVKVAEKVIADIAGLPADGPTVSLHTGGNSCQSGMQPRWNNNLPRIKHNKDAVDSFDPELFVKKMTERKPVVQEVDIGTGWVHMENGVPKTFTPNAWTSIADCINTTPEELTRMFVRHLSSRTIDHDHKVAGLCFQIKEMLLDGYGLSAHRRKSQ